MASASVKAVLAAAAALSSFAQGPQRGAAVSGKVVGSDGKPLGGISLLVTPVAVKQGDANPGVFTAISAADGTYSIGSLPAGEYNVCASDEAERYLNSCSWSGPVRVELAGQQTKAGVDVQVEDAAELTIEINDPGQLLSTHGAAPAAHTLLIGIPGVRMFLPVAVPQAAGKPVKARVPYDRDVQVYVGSPTLALRDAAGRALNAGGDKVKVRIPRGEQRAVSITVTGVAGGN